MRSRPRPYWFIITPFLLGVAVLLVVHYATGTTPDREAFNIFGLSIYWYAVWIIVGVLAGTLVAADLARERAKRAFAGAIPVDTAARPLTGHALPDRLLLAAGRRGINTLGGLLYEWGLDPGRLGIKKDERPELGEALAAAAEIAPRLLTDAPWRGWNPDHAWNALALVLIFGVIGARLYHVLTPSPSMAAVGINSALDYLRNPYALLDFRSGGLGIYGGMLGGLLGLWLYTRRARVSTAAWADLAAVGMALGQSIGRWGNYFNQELYGRPTDLPWAITIDPVHRLPAFADFARFHPAFLYESIWSFLSFLLLLWLARHRYARLLTGELLALYLVLYAIGRTLLEAVRLDSRAVALFGLQLNVAVATLVSIIVALAAAAIVIIRRRRRTDRSLNGG